MKSDGVPVKKGGMTPYDGWIFIFDAHGCVHHVPGKKLLKEMCKLYYGVGVMTEWKVGDWVVLDMAIGQIIRLEDDGIVEFSDGNFRTGGKFIDRLRPLTLRNKTIMESFEYYYSQLAKIDGERGFNYPDISRHFSNLMIEAIDTKDGENMFLFNTAQDFVRDAREYKKEIQGVSLFRRKLG